ncbi:hypothetical protein HZA40_02280 [Candidatus Peregrinibacteria bacterium]|nr:hypothetical protein [Candidatus Peregrinibacteria bacterium]
MNVQKNIWQIITFALLLAFLTLNLLFKIEITPRWKNVSASNETSEAGIAAKKGVDWEEKLYPVGGAELAVRWGDLGQKLIAKGVIDKDKFENLYAQRGGMDVYEKSLIYGTVDGKLKITGENSGFLLNIFWALGLSNKNSILDTGPMRDKRYGGAENFASTGGWSVAKGNTMDHYSKYNFIVLTPAQQTLVEKVAQNIYRPCCDNSTYFPDCNHGMAMLGFLELMASQGATEQEMYSNALTLNSYWFPATYPAVAQYLEKIGTSWDKTSPQEILGVNYSSSSGFRQILSKINPAQSKGGPGCGV